MTKELFSFDLSKIADGGAQEKFNSELKKVADNILDMNTEAKTKRKVTLELTFIPNDKRDVITVAVNTKTKLAPRVGVSTSMMLGRDVNTGMMGLAELKSGVPGQTYFDPEDSTQKTDTGEPVAEVEVQETNVIDLQHKG